MPSKMKDNFNQLFFSWGAQLIFLNLIIQYFLIICAIYSAKNKGLKAIFQLVFSSGTSMMLLKISDTLRVPVKLASPYVYMWASLGSSYGKESACNRGDLPSIPESERSPGEGNGNPLLYFYLENSIDRGAWQSTVHGVAKSGARLSNKHFHFHMYIVIQHIYL